MMTLWDDLRLALRTWRRTPALAAVVIVTLALGIGATTAAFTLAYTVLIQPLPFPDPARLVWVSTTAFIGSLTALMVVTIVGACIPARRAARVDVTTTLRLEG
jgi:ABC-type antimicrobial peptide transport system permease subunit